MNQLLESFDVSRAIHFWSFLGTELVASMRHANWGTTCSESGSKSWPNGHVTHARLFEQSGTTIFKFCHVSKVRLVRGLPLFVPPSRGDGGSTHGGSRSCCAVGSGTLSALLQLKLCPYFSCDFSGEPGIVKAQKFKVLGNVALLALGCHIFRRVGCFRFYFDLTFSDRGLHREIEPRSSTDFTDHGNVAG